MMHSGGRYLALTMTVALAWASPHTAHAAAAVAPGHAPPDWNGVWVLGWMAKPNPAVIASPGRFDPAAAARLLANVPAYKGKYLEQFQALQRSIAEGKPVDDLGALCLPQGMPGFWVGPYAFEILQTPRQINLYQEWNEQTRRIYLNENKQPADLDPSYNGHSIGHWEGDVLVVDTAAVRADTLVLPGIGISGPHSDAMHISERFQSEGPDRLQVTMTVDDPKAFSKPWVDVVHLLRKPGMQVMEYVCEENNRNPVGANGETEAVLDK